MKNNKGWTILHTSVFYGQWYSHQNKLRDVCQLILRYDVERSYEQRLYLTDDNRGKKPKDYLPEIVHFQ